jgi:uncharacterized membrane protein YfcA
MFLYIFYGFAACLTWAELFYLVGQLIPDRDPAKTVLNLIPFVTMTIWGYARSPEGQPNAKKWLAATAGSFVGALVVVLFLRWDQPAELPFALMPYPFILVVMLAVQGLGRRRTPRPVNDK